MVLPKARMLFSLAVMVICQSLCLPTFADPRGTVFRYVDGEGRTVFNSHVPAEYVANGYTILNDRGQVVEVIPRAKTAAELAELEAIAAADKAAAEAKKTQEQADQLLIRLYRAPEEIDRKRDNMLAPIDNQIGLLTGYLSKANQNAADAQTIVDNYVKANKDAPADIVARVERSKEEAAGLQIKLDALQADRSRIIADAERDSIRLGQLLGTAEQTAAE